MAGLKMYKKTAMTSSVSYRSLRVAKLFDLANTRDSGNFDVMAENEQKMSPNHHS
jgi:hypothetical protein